MTVEGCVAVGMQEGAPLTALHNDFLHPHPPPHPHQSPNIKHERSLNPKGDEVGDDDPDVDTWILDATFVGNFTRFINHRWA